MKTSNISAVGSVDIVRLRSRIVGLQDERATLRDAGMNSAERRAYVAAFCRDAAGAGDARIGYAVAADDLAGALSVRVNPAGVADLSQMLAALLGADVLAGVLNRRLPNDEAPDAAARSARIVAIDSELDRIEREEEAEIVRREAAGNPVARRGDARPEIVLEVVA